MLSQSIMQLAKTQSHSLEIFAAQQKSQIDVYQELTSLNKEKSMMHCSLQFQSSMVIVPSVNSG